eukprot:3632479-Pleurochrysis_carterae.AAC.1
MASGSAYTKLECRSSKLNGPACIDLRNLSLANHHIQLRLVISSLRPNPRACDAGVICMAFIFTRWIDFVSGHSLTQLLTMFCVHEWKVRASADLLRIAIRFVRFWAMRRNVSHSNQAKKKRQLRPSEPS